MNSTQQVTEPVETTDNPTPESGSEESFFDPNNVPDELKPAYKQMQSAWTKKTQELAEMRKEHESYKTKAEQFAKYESYIPVVEEMLSGRQQPVQTPELSALEEQYRKAGYDEQSIEFMKMGIGFALNHINQTSQAKEQSSWLNNQIETAGAVDPRLNDANLVYETGDGEKATFGQIVEELVAADPSWRKDPVAATKRAVRKIDALIGKAKTEGKEELSTLAKTKATKFPPTNSSPQGSTATNQSLSIRDAFKQAQTETGIAVK